MASEVLMNTLKVQAMSKRFKEFGDILKAVSVTMNAINTTLKILAWVSGGATAAAALWVDHIQPQVEEAAKEMYALSGDLTGAIKSYSDGDKTGSQRFVS